MMMTTHIRVQENTVLCLRADGTHVITDTINMDTTGQQFIGWVDLRCPVIALTNLIG